MTGEPISSEALQGKVVVYDFWATWCPACRESTPELRDLAKKYGDKVTLVSVSADEDRKPWMEYVQKQRMTWPQVFDGEGQLCRAFKVQAFPTYVIVDRDGFIHEQIIGTESLVGRLKAALRSLPELEGVAQN